MRSWQMDVERDHTKRQIRHLILDNPEISIDKLSYYLNANEEEIRIILQMIADEDKTETQAEIAD